MISSDRMDIDVSGAPDGPIIRVLILVFLIHLV
jgi:hypothetical protein